MSIRPFAAAALAMFALATPLCAQSFQDGDGYSFSPSVGSLSLRAGFAKPNAGSSIFDFTSDLLTLKKGSFSGFSGAIDAGFRLHPRVEVLVGAAVSSRTIGSNYRNFVDNNDAEIEQSTIFTRVPLTVGARFYLIPPVRTLGKYAHVPNKVAPYIAAGGGGVFYKFRQEGDFVDFRYNDVFSGTLQSEGWTGTLYGAGGMTWALSPHSSLVTEARYDVARAAMSTDFKDFERIDLSGVSVTAGILLRF